MHQRNRFRSLLVLGLVCATLASGCGAGDGDAPPEDAAPDVDELRSMPYLGFTKDRASPSTRGVLYIDRARSQPGYTLFTVRNLGLVDLVNADGELIRRWQVESGRLARAALQPDGSVLLVGRDRERYVMRQSWSGDVLWRHDLLAHHDVGLTPDGRVMLLTLAERDLPSISTEYPVRDDQVSILDDEGRIVEQLSLYDAMSEAGFEFLEVSPHPVEKHIDLFHSNSVQWMNHEHLVERDPIYDLGNVIVSIRHQNTVAIFDWRKREMLWEWGRGEISGQHDAQVLANGNLLIFDNGMGRAWSRVIELDPLAKRIVWDYRAPEKYDFYTLGRGSNQRLANGNTLITESDAGRIFEVTPEGHVVWEFLSPHFRGQKRATFVRGYRYDLAFVEGLLARGPDPSDVDRGGSER